MALVQSGDTTVGELRRVAAEPVRVINEPVPASSSARVRIGWIVGPDRAPPGRVHDELVAAAAALGTHVQIVSLSADAPDMEGLDALVLGEDDLPAPVGLRALVVSLAANPTLPRCVATLARDVDLVVSRDSHGRVLLATILALLRWRSRQ
jgi:hypothetical protein